MARRDISHEAVAAAFRDGATITAIADDWNCSQGTIRRILVALELVQPSSRAPSVDVNRVAALYAEGATIAAIAEQLGSSTWKVKTALDSAGVERRTRADYEASGRRSDIDEHAVEICRLYREEGLDERGIADRFGCGRETIRRILRESGVEPIHSPRSHRKPGVRPCSACELEKPVAAFYPRRGEGRADSFMSSCIDCLSVQQAKRYASDPEYYRERSRIYYNADVERGRRIAREWRARNPEAVRATWRAWYLDNAEERRAYAEEHREHHAKLRREWADTEKGKASRRAARMRRRARERELDDDPVDGEFLLALQAATSQCEICDAALDYETRGAVHLDHIVPLAANGVHAPPNLRYICGGCNLARPKDGRDVATDHPARAFHETLRTVVDET